MLRPVHGFAPSNIQIEGVSERSMPTATGSTTPRGLEGVVATTSNICYIDGDRGVLAYRGIDIHELADHSTFEETCYLLWFGNLPTRHELRELHERLVQERKLDASIVTLLRNAPRHALPMDVLRTAVSALSFYDPQEKSNDREANVDKTIRLTSQIAMIVAAYDRIRKGQPIVEPDRSLSHAANFLLMLNGTHPSSTAERALDIALILHADHELNASTFAARLTAATLSDMHSAITSASGALKGPLHSGANEDVIRMLLAAGNEQKASDHVKEMLVEKKKVPGFGHRVYHTEDPRATHLRALSEELGHRTGHLDLYLTSKKIEETIKSTKGLNANVDFYSASTYYSLGIPIDLFTPIFAVSRMSGWTAHVLEQYRNNRLIRPRAEYTGKAVGQQWVPIFSRS